MSATLLDKAVGRMRSFFPSLPWTIRMSYRGTSATLGTGPERLDMVCKSDGVLRDFARGDLSSVLDRYVAGELDFDGDMYAFVGTRNHLAKERLWMVGLNLRVRHAWTTIFPSGIRRKIVAVSSHYDLPSEFILSYLDKRTKAYSCAMWRDPGNILEPSDESLEDAQHRKFKIAADALEIQPDDRFLDVGCGYGYMVRLAETEFGCRRTLGITLSENQVKEGFSKNLALRHYHELEADGSWDKIYTCGMVSHLDRSEIVRYYRHIYGLLRNGGRFWMHGIVPPANNAGLNNYNTLSGTFSQKYVFPDHYQFPVHVHLKIMEEVGFDVQEVYYRYGHYGKTLRHWYKRYVENLPRTRRLINPTIERAWHLYLTYASVLDGDVSIIKQILATKK
jgi:cyclopropane-fatty-acyl-phospholipid synthase